MGPAATVNYEAAGASDDWAKVFTIFTIIDNDHGRGQHHAMSDDWAKVVSIVIVFIYVQIVNHDLDRVHIFNCKA